MGRGELRGDATWLKQHVKGNSLFGIKDHVKHVGGSIKETRYKGALGPPGKPIGKGLAADLLVFKSSAQSNSCLSSPDPWVQLEPDETGRNQHELYS